MNNSTKFHGIVSLGAAAAAVVMPTTGAMAQDAVPTLKGYSLTIDGGLSMSDYSQKFDEALFEGKGGSPFDYDKDKGFYGSVALSRQISDTWDWRVSGSVLGFKENEASYTPVADTVFFRQKLTGITAGGDFGRHMHSGNTDIRLGFGVLAAHYKQDTDFGLTLGGGKGVTFDFPFYQEYRGVGPSLSADLRHPVGTTGRTSLIAGASLAPTFGEFTVGVDGLGSGTIDGKALISSAYLGLSMQQSEAVELRLGVRVDGFSGDADGGAGSGLEFMDGTILTTTAFAGLKVKF